MKSFYTLALAFLFSLIVSNAALANPESHQQMKSPPKNQENHKGKDQGPLSDIRRETRSQIQVFRKEQEQKRKEFVASIKELPPEARQKAMLEHMEEQQRIRVQFHESLHTGNLAKLTEQLNQNSDLTEDKKQNILTAFNAHYEKQVEKQNARYNERRNTLLNIVNDESLTTEQKQERLHEYRKRNRNHSDENRQNQGHQRNQNNEDSL